MHYGHPYLAVFAVVALVAVLSGCSQFREHVAQQDDALCQSYGALPGTPQYTDCRLRLRQEHIAAFGQGWSSTVHGLANAGDCANLPPGPAIACGAAGAR
jgi:hypothetical protein